MDQDFCVQVYESDSVNSTFTGQMLQSMSKRHKGVTNLLGIGVGVVGGSGAGGAVGIHDLCCDGVKSRKSDLDR